MDEGYPCQASLQLLFRKVTFAVKQRQNVMALSLPGLGLEEPEDVQTVETSQHNLSAGCEWRFEVAVGKYVNVTVHFLSSPCTGYMNFP